MSMLDFKKSLWLIAFLTVLLLSRQSLAATDTKTEPRSDVRILIDVSGSMKKNDPKNLRVPALKMLVGLMPEQGQSGVWTFAKYVNMLVPIKPVNDAWRMEAEKRAKDIHSYGLFTNIEQALNKATASHKKADKRFRRSVILLSDGLVDIETGEKMSQQSRQRILDSIVPRLKNANVSVHTIALSENADHELLKTISLETDGWYEQVDTADELQRVFLHLFEKAAQRDTVPLSNENIFKIDDTVTEMTMLVFRKEGTAATELIMPDQTRLSNTNYPTGVRWHHEASYDLITVDNPPAGAWKIVADFDPDNRVMVVTDMKLQTTDLPNNILIGETFDLEASLTEKGKVIVRKDFLDLVDAKLMEENEIDYPVEISIKENLQEGVFHSNIGDNFKPGRNDVVITMTSATFERQRRQSINVVDNPFSVYEEQLTDTESRSHRITLKPDTALIATEGLSIAAMLTAEDGSEWSYDVMQNGEQEWQLTLAELEANETYSVALQVKGETLKGRSVFLTPTPITLIDKNIPEPIEEVVEEITNEVVEDEPEELIIEDSTEDSLFVDASEESLVETIDEPTLDEEQAEEVSESSVTVLIVGNVLILVLIGLGVFMWRRQAKAMASIGDDL
jgi:hypothetical protein